ncbi:Pyruvate kinase (PK), partial [Durusdinium trenchii]
QREREEEKMLNSLARWTSASAETFGTRRHRRVASVASDASSQGGSSKLAQMSMGKRRRSSSIQFGPGMLGWAAVSNVSVSDVLFHGTEDSITLEGVGDLLSQAGISTSERPSTGAGEEEARSGSSSASKSRKKGRGLVRRRRRTRIICAIGPASREVSTLVSLLEAGMNVARLNFSHGNHEYHAKTLQNIKEAVAIRKAQGVQCHCAVLMDTKGPEIRTGMLRNHEGVQLRTGQRLEITTDYTLEGDESIVACSYPDLCSSVYIGGLILIADGSIQTRVIEIRESSVVVQVENNALLGERKNMNLPGVSIRLPGITEKDEYDLKNFALKHEVDIVSGSFIRTAANVRAIRECLGEEGKHIRVHAKIESVEAIQNIHEILDEADGIHVSRGDLGMELPLSKLFLAQKGIIRWANLAGKPVVTSTQMLDSMTTRPRPTNAECGDVANAVLDGTDCVMLSAETANGLYPRESVDTMTRIIAEAELVIDYESHFSEMRDELLRKGNVSTLEALSSSAVETAMDIHAQFIVLISETGKLAMLVAKYRPLARILVVTGNETTARQMSVSRGVSTLLMDNHKLFQPEESWMEINKYVLDKRWASVGDRVVLVFSLEDIHKETMRHWRETRRINDRLSNTVEVRLVTQTAYEFHLRSNRMIY